MFFVFSIFFRDFVLTFGSIFFLLQLLSVTEFTKVNFELFCCGFNTCSIKHYSFGCI